MALPGIRVAASDVLRSIDEIKSVLAWPSEKAPMVVPACWIDYGKAAIKQGARSEWTWTLPLTCVLFRKGDITRELAAVEPLAELIERAYETAYTLGSLTSGFQLTNFHEGEVTFAGGEKYVGFTQTYTTIERRVTTLEG